MLIRWQNIKLSSKFSTFIRISSIRECFSIDLQTSTKQYISGTRPYNGYYRTYAICVYPSSMCHNGDYFIEK